MAATGLYVVMLLPVRRIKTMASEFVRSPLLIGVAIAALVGLAFDYIPQMTLQFGYLGLIASYYPTLLGSSLVYWVLTPTGAVFLVWSLFAYREDPAKSLGSFALVMVVLTSLASTIYFQRYVDVPLLVVLAVLISGDEHVHRLDLVRWWLLAAAFVGWVFAYVKMAGNALNIEG
jgi:hypothetical protein